MFGRDSSVGDFSVVLVPGGRGRHVVEQTVVFLRWEIIIERSFVVFGQLIVEVLVVRDRIQFSRVSDCHVFQFSRIRFFGFHDLCRTKKKMYKNLIFNPVLYYSRYMHG